MRAFHLPPDNPYIQNMTLEQKNFVIASLNEDQRERNGKTGEATVDTQAQKWLDADEKHFHVLPKGLNKKAVLHNIWNKVGLSELQIDHADWEHKKRIMPLKHAQRVRTDQLGEHNDYLALRAKTERQKRMASQDDEISKLYGDSDDSDFD